MSEDEKIYDEVVEMQRHPGRRHTQAELRKIKSALKNGKEWKRKRIYAVFARDRFERRIARLRRAGPLVPLFEWDR
jgi:hypothetical protein